VHDARVTLALLVTSKTEIFLSVALLLFVVLVILLVARSSKPDPKMALLLSLMESWPRDADDGDVTADKHEEESGTEEHGPLGPGGFTLSA
jgi:hypothetical protein